MFSTVAFEVHLLDSVPELELPMTVPADDTTEREEKRLFSELEVHFVCFCTHNIMNHTRSCWNVIGLNLSGVTTFVCRKTTHLCGRVNTFRRIPQLEGMYGENTKKGTCSKNLF